jgi:pyruvate dehydrogenase E2 component (dihydrolipoamide acetyltransferase)
MEGTPLAIDVVMPRLGWTMETGTIAEWLKKDGDVVQAGEIIFTVESDKALQEVEAFEGGILRIRPSSMPGTEVAVGTVLAYLVQPGEAAPLDALPADDAHVPAASNAQSVAPARSGRHTPPISPRARRVALDLGVAWETIIGSGRTGRIVERDVRALAAQSVSAAPARVTPLARRVAQQAGVDLDEKSARLSGQRVTKADVAAAATTTATSAPDGTDTRPMGTTRRVIAQRMAESAHTATPVTLTTDAEATEFVRLREKIKASLSGSDKPIPSYTDLLARLVALALLEHPWMNASLVGDSIVQHGAVHMGLAVDTERGLLVPVVRDAHAKAVQAIAAESARLIERAQAGTATPEDLRGGTFTITNLGMYEIDAFTPIINLPECAVLGVGRIVARAMVLDEAAGEIAVRKMMALSLTFDHRLVDGAPAARFLQRIKHWIEEPYGWATA